MTANSQPKYVDRYGARGDGLSDDTSAINSAISAVHDGDVIWFPVGTYRITSTIQPKHRIRFQCLGAVDAYSMTGPCTFKKASTINGPAILLTGNSVRGSVLEGITVDGEPGNRGPGIQGTTSFFTLRDVLVRNQGGDGIVIGSDTQLDSLDAVFSRLDSVTSRGNSGRGFYISQRVVSGGYNNANGGVWTNVVAQSNSGDGFAVGCATNNTFVGITAEGNGGIGLHFLAGSARNRVFGGDLNEGNRAGNLKFDSGSSGNVVQADVSNKPPFYVDDTRGSFDGTNQVIAPSIRNFGQAGGSYGAAGFGIGPNGGTGFAFEVHYPGKTFSAVRVSDDAGAVVLGAEKARGNETAPAAVQNGNGIGRFYFSGYDGSGYESGAFIGSAVDGAVSEGQTPANIALYTCPTSASCAPRMVVTSKGDIRIPSIRALNGTRFVCVDTSGSLISQTTPCSGN